jgi:hypothetical protein
MSADERGFEILSIRENPRHPRPFLIWLRPQAAHWLSLVSPALLR